MATTPKPVYANLVLTQENTQAAEVQFNIAAFMNQSAFLGARRINVSLESFNTDKNITGDPIIFTISLPGMAQYLNRVLSGNNMASSSVLKVFQVNQDQALWFNNENHPSQRPYVQCAKTDILTVAFATGAGNTPYPLPVATDWVMVLSFEFLFD